MRAVWLRQFGGPEVLEPGTAHRPLAGPGQAVVATAFVNVTFLDTIIRSGAPGPFAVEPPVVLGNGVGGVVAAVGAGVDTRLVGRRAVATTGGSGGYAELAAVSVGDLTVVPDGLALDAATALLADGRTAVWILESSAVAPGDVVLIDGAAGGVGSMAVQLARAAGATVVALAGGPAKVALARDLGAHVAVDYLLPGWPGEVRAAVDRVDVVLDGVGGAVGRAAFGMLGPGGRMSAYGLTSGEGAGIAEEDAAARGVRLVHARPTPDDIRRCLGAALEAAAAGRLRPLIGQRFPLEEAAAAHAAIAARSTVGKTLLTL